MSARDPLAEVIRAGAWPALMCDHPNVDAYDPCWDCAADAVRAFLASDETVERASAVGSGLTPYGIRIVLSAATEVR